MQETWGSIPGLGRSPGGMYGNKLQHSCLENPHGQRSLGATVHQFSSVQLLSRVWLFAAPWTAARQASRSITSSQSLLKLMSIKSVMPSNHFILCHPYMYHIWTHIYSPCMILYAPLHKCTDHPIIQSLSLQRYVGYSPRPLNHWPKKFCTSEHEIKISLLFSKGKELFLKVLVLKTAWQHVFIL